MLFSFATAVPHPYPGGQRSTPFRADPGAAVSERAGVRSLGSPVESAAVRVDVAEQLRIGTAVPEGDQSEHAPLDAVVVGRSAIAGNHVHDTLTLGADPRDGPT